LALRPARHDDLKSFRVLVIETHHGNRGARGARAVVGATRPVGRENRSRESIAAGPGGLRTSLHAAIVLFLGSHCATRRL
jgi:hypothetical protein